jgi:hypothetical protein
MQEQVFDRRKHVYENDALVELVKDAVRFFNGTPVHRLPTPESFTGAGVYALYYTGQNPLYAKYAQLNRLSYSYPIYVGKAVPRGWRQSRASNTPRAQSTELHSRLREHFRNIETGAGIEAPDFSCRFAIFEADGSDMISTIEASLIKLSRPLWNSVLDGFGNHTPGNGRFQQAKSDWDVIHPGREWADKCQGIPNDRAKIIDAIDRHVPEIKA